MVRRDYLYQSWMLRLMIAYELEYDNFDNLYRATQRFFDKVETEDIVKAYLLFLKFLYKINRSPGSEIKALFIECKAALLKLKMETGDALKFGEITRWIDHMVTKESLVDIYKKQLRSVETA